MNEHIFTTETNSQYRLEDYRREAAHAQLVAEAKQTEKAQKQADDKNDSGQFRRPRKGILSFLGQ